MHELSIAMSIIEGASQEAMKRGGAQVHAVHLKLGPLSGVVKEALLFSYGLACEGTTLEGSQLLIEEVPVVVYCPNCETEKTLESIQRFCCPTCGALSPDVVSGKQLELVGIEITDGEDVELAPEIGFAEAAV
ncbi:MAG: hydrogenase maturation nickel metallochaperone HypA [Acidobacteriota bacterium]|nr:hydrogenase maturation nickel metallochaperone HypA [Acidobacteriota bacterium]